MIVFWVVAGVLSAAAAGLILQTAARAALRAGSSDPTSEVYRRQLREFDDLAERGLIAEGERKSAHAEAARRLLSVADAAVEPWTAEIGHRRPVLVAALVAPLAALGLYLAVGAPGLADQPFGARIATWRALDPSMLTAPQMAVVLKALIAERGPDAEAYGFLAKAEIAAGNPSGAIRALRRGIELAPRRVDLWEGLGEVLMIEAGGQVTPQAQRAFAEALKRDPRSAISRFHLAAARIEAGDRAGGLADWKALASELPRGDPRRAAVETAIAQAQGAPAAATDQMAAIRGMVEGLAARLEASPEDPEGWVRLVRSQAVLGQDSQRDAALAKARARYADRPEILKALDIAAKTAPMRRPQP
ncbi:c-type cytochrome biogenesis protein CcmI [Phenylobacterium sp.]|uniref:c-type cytochrome biogenesis protein CcmI n=1 Tax=Phenylobacterium sp. TaxID=1871053 RepID=UPI002735566C|nr:c-type cytochrome biogenesis protein CcmI [Phenylobacterium sp.]MDP3853358.1 c-type cytochrome biogenesis protein CcmI [Phenylobacterium sp.]